MDLKDTYTNLEDKWYATLDRADNIIPVYKIIDPVDKVIPSFILFLIILIILILFLSIMFLTPTNQTHEFEVLILNNNNLPIENAKVTIYTGCIEDKLELITNKNGKINTLICGDEIEVHAKKTGYETKGSTFPPQERAILKLNPPIQQEKYATILIEDEELILGANIELICDTTKTHYLNQTNTGFFITIPQTCGHTQIKATAQDYEEKTITLTPQDERKIITLTKIEAKGIITFEVKVNQEPTAGVTIALTNQDGQTAEFITNDFGESKNELTNGTYTYITNYEGTFTPQEEFTLFTKENKTIPININHIEQAQKKFIAINLQTTDEQPITMAKIKLHRDNTFFKSKRTNLQGKTTNQTILKQFENSNYNAIITAEGYGITRKNLELLTEGYQTITLEENDSTLKVNVYNDQNELEKNAKISMKYPDQNTEITSGTTDQNGIHIFKNLPIGQILLKAQDESKNDEITQPITLIRNQQREINLYLNTGKGKIEYSFYDQDFEKTDTNFIFNDIQKTTRRNKFSSTEIKNKTKVNLTTDNNTNYNYTDFEYQIKRGTTEKEIYLRKLGELPNNNPVQMFLKKVYKTNPKTESVGRNNTATKIMPGETYYLLFETITTTNNSDTLLNNFVIGDATKETTLDENATIQGIYSIKTAKEIMTNNYTTNIIDTTMNEYLVSENAKQANTIIPNIYQASTPTILKIRIDENSTGKVIIHFNATHEESTSFEYTKEFIIGETFCVKNCPDFFFNNFLIRDGVETIVDEYASVFIDEEYKLKTIVKNNSDNDFGPVSFITIVPKTYQRYLLLEDDKNSISKNIVLNAFDNSPQQLTALDLKSTRTTTLFQKVEKMNNGIDILKNNPGNNASFQLKIKNKKVLAIDVSSRNIDAGAYYPLKTIRTRYNTSSTGVSAHWFAEVNGEQIMNGTTDENGIDFIAFDARNLQHKDNVKFTVYDNADSIRGYYDINIDDIFRTVEEPDECLSIKLNNQNYVPNQTVQTLNKGEITNLKIISACDINRIVKLYSDLDLSQITTTIPANTSKNIVITANPRGNLFGVYPVQVFANNGSVVKEIALVDIIVKDPDSCFDLEQAIFDMTTTGKISSKVTNSCLAGRLDNFYPKLNLGTNSVSLDFKKPGLPRDINLSIKVRGSAIESYVNGLVKSEKIMVRSGCGKSIGSNSKAKYSSVVPTSNFTDDEIEEICEDVQRDYDPVPRPEPERDSPQTIQREFWTPSKIYNEGEVSINTGPQTKEKRVTFDPVTAITTNYLKDYVPVLNTEGQLVHAIMPIPMSEIEKTINTTPSRYTRHQYEFFWDKSHDHTGTINDSVGGYAPDGVGAALTYKGQLYINDDPMWQYAPLGNFDDKKTTYYKIYDESDRGKTPIIKWAGSPTNDTNKTPSHSDAIYYRAKVKSDDCGQWFHSRDNSSIGIQIDRVGITEFLKEQRNETVVNAIIQPIEGRVYNLGSYTAATPITQWEDIEEVRGNYESGDTYTTGQSKFEIICVVKNGFVDPTVAETVGHQWADSYNGMPIRITLPDAALDSVEYSDDGYIWYYIWPWEYDTNNYRVYLEDGDVFVEYVGVPEINGNNIDFNITKNNLLGNEYKILEVADWTGNTKETTAYQIKLKGNSHECYAQDGTEGTTTSELASRLNFNWNWGQINTDHCDSDNSSYKYCDGTQFTISLFKKLKAIEVLLKANQTHQIPEKTVFYSHLIKDTYNQNFLNDFVTYYSNTLAQSEPEYSNKFFKFITENKINFDTNMPYGGLYRIEIDINKIDSINSLFDGENINSNINIKITPVYKANNYNTLYETPFDGLVGHQNRNGYGTSFSQKININNNLVVSTAVDAEKHYTIRNSENLDLLNKGIVFEMKNDTILIAPSQPNPITISTTSNDGIASMGYKIENEPTNTLTHNTWKMIASNIGGRKCRDFEDNEGQIFDIIKNNSKEFVQNWNGTKDGTVTLATVIFTPPTNSQTPSKITPLNELTKMTGYSGLKNSNSYMLNNYENDNLDFESLRSMLTMVSENKMCISKDQDNFKIFWNNEYLNELINEVKSSRSSRCN
jgi:hypothetical protein